MTSSRTSSSKAKTEAVTSSGSTVDIERRLSNIQSRTAIVAAVVSLLGSGGIVGLFQHFSGERLRAAEATLKEQQVRHKDSEEMQRRQLNSVEVQLKNLQREREEFDLRLRQHQAAMEALDSTIQRLRKSGATAKDVESLERRMKESSEFFADQMADPSKYTLAPPQSKGGLALKRQ